LKKALCISAIASNQGKTLLTMALLLHYKDSVRPFKIGPDFIDPQFHSKIAQTHSINLDAYMMNKKQLQWIFSEYANKDFAIVEGVMGFYDGMDKGASAYDVSQMLDIASVLILDASGSYITIVAVLKGLITFRENNTIKAIVLNKVSSKMHYDLIKKHIKDSYPEIIVAGWIQKNLQTLNAVHLGLDLSVLSLDTVALISGQVLEHIDIKALESIMDIEIGINTDYPFKKIIKKRQKCAIVKDENFSFIYYDNIAYLKQLYKEVVFVNSLEDQVIPSDADKVILSGGYVETEQSYNKIKNSTKFKNSLIKHAKQNKEIYAECAGLIYLGEKIDDKKMSGILPISFALENKRVRLGYYKAKNIKTNCIERGHAFHYSSVLSAPKGQIILYKVSQKLAKDGGWIDGNIYGSFLHTMWRV
jgi:cobyrinic acid a,c-diamide synthase